MESETVIQQVVGFSNEEILSNDEFLIYEALQYQQQLSVNQVVEILGRKTVFPIIKDLIEKRSNLESFKYKYSCEEAIYWDNINDAIKINLYRILQEALQNIIKYADATYVEIKISLNNNNIELLVKDNGKGFNTRGKRKGIGLKNMQSRAEKIDGTIKINSLKNGGTTIFVTCPTQTEHNEHKI